MQNTSGTSLLSSSAFGSRISLVWCYSWKEAMDAEPWLVGRLKQCTPSLGWTSALLLAAHPQWSPHPILAMLTLLAPQGLSRSPFHRCSCLSTSVLWCSCGSRSRGSAPLSACPCRRVFRLTRYWLLLRRHHHFHRHLITLCLSYLLFFFALKVLKELWR